MSTFNEDSGTPEEPTSVPPQAPPPVAPPTAPPAAAPVTGVQPIAPTPPTAAPGGGAPPAFGPPPGTAAYEAGGGGGDAGPAGPTTTMARKSAIVTAVVTLIIGLVGGMGVGYGIWHDSGSTTVSQTSGPGGGQFPGANGTNGNRVPGNGEFPGGGQFPRAGGQGGTGQGTAGGRIGFPVAVGKVTSVSGNTVEVEGANGTTKVTMSDSTAVTKTETGDSNDVANGVCVRVEGSTTGGAATATAIQVTQPTNGTCQSGFRGGANAGGAQGGAQGGAPGSPGN